MFNYGWDTDVILAWLTDDLSAPLADIASVVEEIDNQTATLTVSVEVYSEVLEARHTKEQMEEFEKFLKRSNVIMVNKDERIARKSGEIRTKGIAEQTKGAAEGRRIKGPDATHLATAIVQKVDVFHTLDLQLLNLSRSPIVDGLRIERPITLSGQSLMF